MTLQIFKYEIYHWLKNPAVWIYSGIAFLFGLMSMAGNAGLWGQSDYELLRVANAPYALFQNTAIFTKVILFIVPAVLGQAVCRDYDSRSHHILFSCPITKNEYLAGKFLSAFSIVIGISTLFLIGSYAGTCLPGLDENRLAPFHWQTYLYNGLIWLFPNVFFISVFSFAVAVLTRSISTGFISVVVMLILRELLLRLTAGTDPVVFAWLLEPLGERATHQVTRMWSIAEQNSLAIAFMGPLFWNRALWGLIAVSILMCTFVRFEFSGNLARVRRRGRQFLSASQSEPKEINWRDVQFAYSFLSNLRKAWLISFIEFRMILRSGAFISILLVGLVLVYVLLSQMNAPYGVRLLPATWVMLAFPVLFFTLLIHFVTFLYAGVLINRSRAHGMMPVVDSTAIPNWALSLSQLLALVMIQFALLLVIMSAGIVVQISQGYYRIEPLHYLFDLFAIHGSGFLIWALVSLLIHSILPNSWLGLLLLILMYFGISELPQLGIRDFVFRFNQTPYDNFYLYYSDFSGHGQFLRPFFIYKLYWLMLGLLAYVLCLGFWQRGVRLTLTERLKTAISRFRKPLLLPAVSLIVAALCFGFWIHQEEMKAGSPHKQEEQDACKHYILAPQPRVTQVKMEMNLFPDEHAFQAVGWYQLVNRSGLAIDSLIITVSPDVRTEFSFNCPFSMIRSDTLAGLFVLRLHTPMLPGDSIRLEFQLANKPNHILRPNHLIEPNGAYLTSLICPAIGYRPDSYSASPADTSALVNHYRSFDSDFIHFETILSTSADQIALTPGELVEKWSHNGRNYFHYRSEWPATNDFAYLSGRYVLTQDQWNEVGIEIYHHPKHRANPPHLIAGLKATLAYCNEHFGPYPHCQIRIAEYSRRAGDFAQSFATIIPYSELGFMTDIDEQAEEGINLPFLGAAHELAHQWWGMQAIPADANGAKMITESMAEYVSLKVLEKTYGKIKALEYLEKSHDIYWRKSIAHARPESPLIENTGNDQEHISYQKGLLALHAMSHYIGEAVLNQAMKGYLQEVRFRPAPYTTSLEMMEHLRRATPDSLHYRIVDLFETEIFYDHQLEGVKPLIIKDKEYEFEVEIICEKYRKNEMKQEEQAIDGEWMEIGFYSKAAGRIPDELRKIKVKSGKNNLRFRLPFQPHKITLDPYLLLLDKNRNDNSIRL